MIIAVLVIIRIALPIVALRVINNKLETLPNYSCIVKGLDVRLLDKAITLKGVEIKKRNGKIDVPFFTSGDIHVNLESYKARTSKVVVDSCRVNFVRGENKETSQFWVDKELMKILEDMPLKQNILIVKRQTYISSKSTDHQILIFQLRILPLKLPILKIRINLQKSIHQTYYLKVILKVVN